jgi:hypothetical protein
VRRAVTILVLAAVLAAPAGAAAKSVTASGDGIKATLTYVKHRGTLFSSHARITISDNGTRVFAGPVSKPHCGNYCEFDSRPLSVVTLAGGPALVLDTYTGGAHCCSYVDIYSPQPSGTWRDTGFDFGDPGYGLRHIGPGGEPEFVTANDAFAYEFTDYAESGMPLRVMQFNGHGFTDVTREYPALIRKDLRVWWKAFQKDHTPGAIGLIAAWAADADNLGRETQVSTTLSRQVAAHRITAAEARHLRAFLKKLGYSN